MTHTAILTINRVLYGGTTHRRVTALEGSSQRVNQVLTLPGTYTVLPGEIYEVIAEAPPRRTRDRYGRVWFDWSKVVEAQRVRSTGQFTKRALMRLPGVGAVRANRLWEAYGADVLQILLDIGQLDQIAATLGGSNVERRAAALIHAAAMRLAAEDRLRQEEFDFFEWVQEQGITNAIAVTAVWRLLKGSDAIAQLRAHPYLLAGLVDWKAADTFGRRLLAARGLSDGEVDRHPDRLLGALDSIARALLARGDTAISIQTIRQALSKRRVSVSDSTLRETLVQSGGQFLWNGEAFQPIAAAWLERQIAERICGIEHGDRSLWAPPSDLDHAVRHSEVSTGITLTDEQRVAVGCLLRSPFGILQGGAGTGKTFAMRVLVDVFERSGGNVVMAALAGKAALQLSRSTGRLARTITQTVTLLQRRRKLETEAKSVSEDLPYLDANSLLIIDEASMVDTASLCELLELVPRGCRLLLVGDQGQLPPVGFGQIFHDLVGRGRGLVNLTRIKRQTEGSGIAQLAAAIRKGKMPERPVSEIYRGAAFVERRQGEIVDAVIALVDQIGSLDGENLMICAARRETVAAINRRFATRKHTEENTIRLSPLCAVAVGDPIVCTRNRYGDTAIGEMRNGMLGRVVRVFPEGDGEREPGIDVLWQGEETPRPVTGEALADVELAYAITCHRAQGSAACNVIVPVEGSPMITRQWLYTAVTRATEHVWLVGGWETLSEALALTTERSTGFRKAMEEQA